MGMGFSPSISALAIIEYNNQKISIVVVLFYNKNPLCLA
jgi:hypothetical protein